MTAPARPLPATLRAIALDPDADPDRAAGIRFLPWREDANAFPRWASTAHRDGRAVATLVVTSVTEHCHVVVMRRGRGGPGKPRYFSTLSKATAAAETAAVAYALRLTARPQALA